MADPLPTLPSDQDATGRTLGEDEIAAVTAALRSGTLTSTKGTAVRQLERAFAALLDVPEAYACSSGTAAIHCAIAAVDPEPGDEIVVTPITDMGALAPVLYQGAIPVFADVDPITCNVTAATIAARITDRTKAIVVTHLFGLPCEVDAIVALAHAKGIPVIEDCAQAFLAERGGRRVGTIGDIGCFSLQQGKHVTCGEGGLVVTRNPDLGRRMRLFVNKAWPYGEPDPDHRFLALNYRMSELQGAVAGAQLPKLETGIAQRGRMAERLAKAIADVPGVTPHAVPAGDRHVYWRYAVHVDADVIPGGPTLLGADLKERGIHTAPRYIGKPAFACQVFREQATFGKSRFPFTLARPDAVDYAPARFPGTYAGLRDILVLPWNERFEEVHVDFIADELHAAAARARSGL